MIRLAGLVTMGTWEAWDLRSEDNVYRYALGRAWNLDLPTFSVTAINPSTARFDVEDRTADWKLVPFAKQEGCGIVDGSVKAGGAVRLVIIESPYAGNVDRNLRYLRACLADCLARGEAPFASHAIYTQPGVLDDSNPEERARGIAAGFAWRRHAHATVVYTDLGISGGMEAGMQHASRLMLQQDDGADHEIETRQLGGEWSQ